MSNWLAGLDAVLQWQPMLFLVVGVIAGIVVGAMPGLTATMTVAILLPFTFGMDPVPAMMLLLGIYGAANYSGAIPAILMRLPGTPAAAATILDGHTMHTQGRTGEALTVSLFASAVGGFVGAVLLAALAPGFARFALQFGAAEFFMLAVFALTIIASLSEGAMIKGLLSGLFGMALATVGTDPIDGHARFTFGVGEVRAGLDFIAVLIGLFGVAEALARFERVRAEASGGKVVGDFGLRNVRLRRLLPSSTSSGVIGFVVGFLPGTGPEIASFVAYNEARRFARGPSRYGRGEPRGVAAADAATNPAVPAPLAPTLVLGIPGNPTAAVLIGAITVHGLRPGPQLFTGSPELVYGTFVGFLFVPVFLLIFGWVGIRLWAQVVRIPTRHLWPCVLVLCIIGSYAVRSNPFDIVVTIAAGIIGYLMNKGGFPQAPLIIGLIVGPLAEAGFRRATIITSGTYEWILQPIPLVLLLLSIASLWFPLRRQWQAHLHRRDADVPAPRRRSSGPTGGAST
jgi:putative tricarboxylic transport membrane protein